VSDAPFLVVDPVWAATLGSVRKARVILALGASDTGKTTLLTYLGGALLDAGRSVAVVDSDLGQSEIGPPTAIGLGRLRRPFGRLADAELVGLYFVGATSPEAHVLPTVVGTHLLTERALGLGFDHVLVDTSGLVQGVVGRRLKREKIDLVRPDLVVCLERAGECEHILRYYAGGEGPAVLRLRAAPPARRRSPEERRRHRERALNAYFARARAVTLDLGRVILRELTSGVAAARRATATCGAARSLADAVWVERPPGTPAAATPCARRRPSRDRRRTPAVEAPPAPVPLGGLAGILAGLDAADGETVGLGIVRAVDVARGTLTIETPVPEAAIATVRLGRQPAV
jgi:polynucleotide 5'-hydroxyl-kinase GRC3/NOL9